MSFRAQRLGKLGERKAADYLRGLGWSILEQGYRSRFGEMDLIAQEGSSLVFVEVKTRSSGRFGSTESVNRKKQAHLAKAALAYLQDRRIQNVSIRFDVIAIEGEKLRHIRDAFLVSGYTR